MSLAHEMSEGGSSLRGHSLVCPPPHPRSPLLLQAEVLA